MTASAGGKGFPQWLRHSENKPKLMDGSERGWLTPATANTLIFSDDRDGGMFSNALRVSHNGFFT